jgi:SAM-dependent methyltransferase
VADDRRTAAELYDSSAASWVRNEPITLSDYTGRPATLELLGDINGEGYVSRQLARKGAKVVGLDVSARMIDAARAVEARDQLGIEYGVGDATDLNRFATGTLDRVLAVFLFNYLDVENTQRTCAEVARVLRPGGRFVFAVPHPAKPWMHDPKPPFYFDVGDAGYFRDRDKRFAGRIWKRDGSSLEVQCVHKTFEDYFDALAAAGFSAMPTLRELHVTPEILAIDPAFFGPVGDTPCHLAIAVGR